MRGQQSPLCLYAFMELSDEIRKLAETHLKDKSHFVVEVITNLRQHPKKLLVILDGDKGISIDDCAELSRELSNALDEGNLISDTFVLEVSTPGLDQPLKGKRQYVKNIGRKVKVKLKDKTVEGKLTAVHEEGIELLQQMGSGKKKEEKIVEIPFEEIDKTFVLVSFK